jgi:hypothetical protein
LPDLPAVRFPRLETGLDASPKKLKGANMNQFTLSSLLFIALEMSALGCAIQEEIDAQNETAQKQNPMTVSPNSSDYTDQSDQSPTDSNFIICEGPPPCDAPDEKCPSEDETEAPLKPDLSTDTSDQSVDYSDHPDDLNTLEVELVSCATTGDIPDDPYTVESVRIHKDRLIMNITYSGGCAEHFFGACNGSFYESEWTAPLIVWHEDNEDPCDGTVRERLAIDLTPLKEEYQEANNTKTGTIAIQLNSWGKTLIYSF